MENMYYLCNIVGSGTTTENPFRPSIADECKKRGLSWVSVVNDKKALVLVLAEQADHNALIAVSGTKSVNTKSEASTELGKTSDKGQVKDKEKKENVLNRLGKTIDYKFEIEKMKVSK